MTLLLRLQKRDLSNGFSGDYNCTKHFKNQITVFHATLKARLVLFKVLFSAFLHQPNNLHFQVLMSVSVH